MGKYEHNCNLIVPLNEDGINEVEYDLYNEWTENVSIMSLVHKDGEYLMNKIFYKFVKEFELYFIDWDEEDVIKTENLSRAIEITKETLACTKLKKHKNLLDLLLTQLEKAMNCGTCLWISC